MKSGNLNRPENSGNVQVFIEIALRVYIHIIKQTRCTKFSNLFWNKILHVSKNVSIHHQEFFTVHTAMRAGSGRFVLILLASCQQTCMTYTIAVCTVKNSWWWTEKFFETSRILFQNKFENL